MSARAPVAMTARSAMGRHHGLRSETGCVRTANEDRMGFRRTAGGEVYVVCDGMGGTKGGARAAQLAVHALIERLNDPKGARDPRKRMLAAFAEANAAVFRHRRPDDPETRDMGSTAVAALLSGTRLLVGHVGDSRAYRWNKARGLKLLTRDHTRVQRLVDAKVITPTEAAVHPEASVLDRAMGHLPQVEAEVSEWLSLNRGDRVLLCSDGLSGYASDAEINAVMNSEDDPQRQADKLTELALKKGGEDNVTVQVVQVDAMNASTLSRFLGSPLLVLLVVTLAYLSMASWFHGEFGKLHAADEDLQRRMAALPQPAPAQPPDPRTLTALIETVDDLKKRLAVLEQPKAPATAAVSAPAKSGAAKAAQKKTPATPPAHPGTPAGGNTTPPRSDKPATPSAADNDAASGDGARDKAPEPAPKGAGRSQAEEPSKPAASDSESKK
jgi:serine/threonine protein phosphatase PrpC